MREIGVGTSAAAVILADVSMATPISLPDGRTRSLFLTKAGQKASAAVLAGRDATTAEELSALEPQELALLAALAERVLRARLRDEDHRYGICRLCSDPSCVQCPIEMELNERVDAKSWIVDLDGGC